MMYIDIHSHLKYDEHGYHVDELLEDMERYGIERRVISSINNQEIKNNNREINHICQKYQKQLSGCAVVNPKCPDAIEQVKEAIALPFIHFLEFDSFEHGYYPELQKNLFEIFELVQETDLLVKVFVGIGARTIPQQWEIYARKFPGIKFIFLHMGCFDYGYTCIDVAKRNHNIYVETSNQYEMQILRKALKELPASKIVFGSKYPERLTISGLHLFDMFQLNEMQKEQIYYSNAKKIVTAL